MLSATSIVALSGRCRLYLPLTRRTSPLVFAGTDAAGLFTPALEVAAAAVERSAARFPRTIPSAPRPQPSGK